MLRFKLNHVSKRGRRMPLRWSVYGGDDCRYDIKGSGIRGPLTEQLRRKENILESIRCTLFYCMLPWWHGNTFALLALCEENPTELPVMTSWRGSTFRIICLLWGKSTLLLLCCYHTPRQRSWGGYTGFTLSVRPSVRSFVRPSVCRPNRVRSASCTILAGSISNLHIESTNFRRCFLFVFCGFFFSFLVWKWPL